jgi:hypothetical protein
VPYVCRTQGAESEEGLGKSFAAMSGSDGLKHDSLRTCMFGCLNLCDYFLSSHGSNRGAGMGEMHGYMGGRGGGRKRSPCRWLVHGRWARAWATDNGKEQGREGQGFAWPPPHASYTAASVAEWAADAIILAA